MKTAAIIVAAGRGRRAGGDIPKQYRMLENAPVLQHTIAAFGTHPDVAFVAVIIHPDDRDLAEKLNTRFEGCEVVYVNGGAERGDSVQQGLNAIPDSYSHVLIHDGARPLVSPALISDVLAALSLHKSAAPALAVTDALWRANAGIVSGTENRDGLWRAQTPQGFDLSTIRRAYDAYPGGAADDVEVARAAGEEVKIVAGDEKNLKITHPDDFARALQLMQSQKTKSEERPMDIRCGNGFDVHRFGIREDGANDYVVLCGIKVPHDQGLLGHSDADVGMHALADAIYGAMAEGDIGRHFPPSDLQWKDAESHIFLTHAVKLAESRGFGVTNLDCTLICEHPKIGPHAEKMQTRLAEITGIDVGRISVKATTSERLGFTGRGEGIAALTSATLVKT